MIDITKIAILSLSWEGGPMLKIVTGPERPKVTVSKHGFTRDYLMAAGDVLKSYAGEMDAGDGSPGENIKASHAFAESLVKLAAVLAPEVDRLAGVDPVERYGPAGGVCSEWCDKCRLFHVVGLSVCPYTKPEDNASDA